MLTTNNGWICPQCNTSLAPWMPYCCRKIVPTLNTPTDILNEDIDKWLIMRTSSVLKAENIYKIKQLIEKTEKDLLKTPNLGRKSLREIKEFLSRHNL